jgi:hypothetical protein
MKIKFFREIKIVVMLCATFVETRYAASLLAALFLWPALLSAQNGVTVSGLAVDTGTVTFNVHWDRNNPIMPTPWSDTVWVFVDYSDAGKMERLLLDVGATLTATSATGVGKVIEVPNNNKGVWAVGNAKDPSNSSGSFSATVKLLFDAATSVAGACAYASNYPPVGKYNAAADVEFKGTPPYELTIESEGATLPPFSISSSTYALLPGWTVSSFIDATGAPGVFPCVPPAAPTVAKGEFCYGASGALVASALGTVTIEWYDALTEGILLHSGEVFSLAPLYDTSAQYYALAMLDVNCRSARTNVKYTVSNCTMSGDCPGFTPGNVGVDTPTAAACSSFYPGQINTTNYPAACVAFDAGWIGN